MAFVPTPHINAFPKDFAKTVLMPGDPNRSVFIAKNYLENAKLINDVRGVKGFTGFYRGKKLSVMASGMGMPSMGIYSYELFNFFDVENIIRIGSCGAISKKAELFDILVAKEVVTDSNMLKFYNKKSNAVLNGNKFLTDVFNQTSKELNAEIKEAKILTTDSFYFDDKSIYEPYEKSGTEAVDMETAALYLNAEKFNKKALAVFTVSDNIILNKHLSSEQREKSFNQMITLALSAAVKL